MFYITSIVCFLLRNSKLSLENKTKLTSCLLDKLQAIPASDIIKTNEQGKLEVNGRELDLEGAKILREGAISLLDSQTRKFVKEQIMFEAVKIGVHFGDTPERVMFAKAAIWQLEQEEEFLKKLSQI